MWFFESGEGGKRLFCCSAQAHKKALASLDDTNKKRVMNAMGDYVTVMSFEEAFKHHTDYVCCRAKGILGSNTGRKPDFIRYVRGVRSLPASLPAPPHARSLAN